MMITGWMVKLTIRAVKRAVKLWPLTLWLALRAFAGTMFDGAVLGNMMMTLAPVLLLLAVAALPQSEVLSPKLVTVAAFERYQEAQKTVGHMKENSAGEAIEAAAAADKQKGWGWATRLKPVM